MTVTALPVSHHDRTLPEGAPTIDDIRAAAARIEGHIIRTPTVPLSRLAGEFGVDLVAKLDNLQHTGSFKERGALNKLRAVQAAGKSRGVIAMSAGNHAQGVAYHATRLGITATIVMPKNTPFNKVERTQTYGAKVVLAGDNLAEAEDYAQTLADEKGLTFVHPYDDPAVIAGQGTAALELIEDAGDFDTLVVPIGGGGLISGMAIAARALNPDVRIIGVQSAAFPVMKQLIEGKEPKVQSSTIAEGIAVKFPGEMTRQIVAELVDDIVVVDEPTLEDAIYALSRTAKLVAEGAGSAAIAALMAQPERFRNQRIATIICGGNIDERLYANVLLRGQVREGKIIRLRIDLPDKPGALAQITEVVAEAGGNIVEIFHQRLFHTVHAKHTTIDVVLETRNMSHGEAIIAELTERGIRCEKLA